MAGTRCLWRVVSVRDRCFAAATTVGSGGSAVDGFVGCILLLHWDASDVPIVR